MGIIDSTHYRLTCKACGTVDTPSAHQKGSGYSGGELEWPGLQSLLPADRTIVRRGRH